MEIASAVMSGVEATLQDFMDGLEKKFAELSDRVETLSKALDSLTDTTDRRSSDDKDAQTTLEDELAAELQPTLDAPVAEPVPLDMGTPKVASVVEAIVKPQPSNLFTFICQQKGG